MCAARKLSVAQNRAPVEQLTVRVRSLAAPRACVSILLGTPRAHHHYTTRQADAPVSETKMRRRESPPFARDAVTGAWAERTFASCVLTTCGMRGPWTPTLWRRTRQQQQQAVPCVDLTEDLSFVAR